MKRTLDEILVELTTTGSTANQKQKRQKQSNLAKNRVTKIVKLAIADIKRTTNNKTIEFSIERSHPIEPRRDALLKLIGALNADYKVHALFVITKYRDGVPTILTASRCINETGPMVHEYFEFPTMDDVEAVMFTIEQRQQ